MSEIAEPHQDEIDAFWTNARMRADLNGLQAYWGPTPLDALLPTISAFGATAEEADELAELIVRGVKTATSGAVWDYEAEDEPLPEVDGHGHPRALIVTTQVEVVPFDEVSAEHAAAEGEGDGSLEHWRSTHQEFFTRVATHENGFAHDMPVLCTRFRVLHSDRDD